MTWRMPVDNHDHQAGGEFLATYYYDGGVRKARSLPHSGQDESGFAGQPIYAIGPGTVVKVGTNINSGWGYHVYINHGGNHYSYYAHMRDVPRVSVGQSVNGGTLLGYVGKTGTQAAGNHLHWGIGIGDFNVINAMGAAARALLVEPEGYVRTNIAAEAIRPDQRRIKGNSTANVRDSKSRSGKKVGELAANAVVTLKNWQRGERVVQNSSDTDIWYELTTGGYLWAGATTDPSTAGVPYQPDPLPPVEAVWHTITVKFNNEAGETIGFKVEHGKTITEPEAPERERFIFQGWAVGGVLFDFSTSITEDVTLEALWAAKPTEPDPEPTDPVEEPVEDPKPKPQPVTYEDEQKAAQLAYDLINGNLPTGNAVVARIRTVVPIVLGPVIAWVASRFPAATDFLSEQAPEWQLLIYGGVSAAAAYGWWALARFLGSRKWFGWDWSRAEKIMLGSSAQPVYVSRLLEK